MLRECPNCHAKVSTRSISCPGCLGPLRQAKRDVVIPVFAWTFGAFNFLMAAWLAVYLITGKATLRTPRIVSETFGGGDAAGTPLGGNLGLGFIVSLWILGLVVLGLCALFSLAHRPTRQANPTTLIR